MCPLTGRTHHIENTEPSSARPARRRGVVSVRYEAMGFESNYSRAILSAGVQVLVWNLFAERGTRPILPHGDREILSVGGYIELAECRGCCSWSELAGSVGVWGIQHGVLIRLRGATRSTACKRRCSDWQARLLMTNAGLSKQIRHLQPRYSTNRQKHEQVIVA